MIGKETAKRWFEECKKEGKRYMNVVCDTYDWSDYPKFTDKPLSLGNIGNMEKVVDVYDTTKPFEEQVENNYKERIGIG